ncbi:hypothetical protein B296_00024638 [Ensete ventricosum]|uniref:Uncharacterized protein n=1 Tax=Ensete ventricosum TaxID=4639 RepID=A0A426YPE0_ENSVE|nr:hypothetical protein B296_00024638 [Ensete ventricosum]
MREVERRFEFRSVFRALSLKIKILAIPDILPHGIVDFRSVFTCIISEIQNTGHYRHISPRFEFRSVFRASSQKFNILAILDVLAHGKPYEHGFEKKRDDHKLCTKSRADSSFDRFFVQSQKFKILAMPDILAHESSFDRFFVHYLGNSKY